MVITTTTVSNKPPHNRWHAQISICVLLLHLKIGWDQMGSVDVVLSGELGPVDSMFPTFSDSYILLFLFCTYFHVNANYFCFIFFYFSLGKSYIETWTLLDFFTTVILMAKDGAWRYLLHICRVAFFWRGFFILRSLLG